VIAIIAILAAILFPVFARAREKARQTSCLSNVKQQSLGVLMYIQDYDETMPGVFTQGIAGQWGVCPCHNWASWAVNIYPYVKNGQIFICPSYSSGWFATGAHNGLNSYGLNHVLCGQNTGPSLANVAYPAECIMITDSTYYVVTGRYTTGGWPRGSYNNTDPRHNEGCNIGFCDGHGKWLKKADFQDKPHYWEAAG